MIRTGLFRNVQFDQIEDRHAQGWMIVAPWSSYSVLMWHCECSQ